MFAASAMCDISSLTTEAISRRIASLTPGGQRVHRVQVRGDRGVLEHHGLLQRLVHAIHAPQVRAQGGTEGDHRLKGSRTTRRRAAAAALPPSRGSTPPAGGTARARVATAVTAAASAGS